MISPTRTMTLSVSKTANSLNARIHWPFCLSCSFRSTENPPTNPEAPPRLNKRSIHFFIIIVLQRLGLGTELARLPSTRRLGLHAAAPGAPSGSVCLPTIVSTLNAGWLIRALAGECQDSLVHALG